MKKIILISIMPILAIFLFIAAQTSSPVVVQPAEDIELGWPDEVMVLLDKACFDCHTSDEGNIKSRGALNFSKWEDYKLTRKINKLNGISKKVKEKKMPPARFLKDNPDKGLTDEEITMITSWANAEADKLIKE